MTYQFNQVDRLTRGREAIIEILLTIFPAGLSESAAGHLKDFAIVMAIAAAGLALARLVWQPPVLGYLLAGLLIGPFTLPTPVISNLDTIELMAELGLVLLLFGIGLELGWRRIREIGFLVLVIGVVEITTLTLLGVLIANKMLGITGSGGLYLGGAMAISSSAILLKGLRDSGNLRSGWGQTIVGILLVEDFAAVILLTLLAGIATTGSTDLLDVSWLVAKLAIFCIAALSFGTLLAPRLMRLLSRTRSDETLLLASLGCCFGLALGAEFLGLSAAAGAFLIGMVIGDTDAAGRVTRLVNPVRDMFGALFFMSIGMLIDYRTLDDFILPALVIVAVFMTGKMVANTIGSILSGRDTRQAVRVGMTMPQMGEFSLAIGRVSATDSLVGATIGPVLAIATAITSVLAPLTSRMATPLCDWTARRAPPTLVEVNLAIQLGIKTFWSAFSLTGQTGRMLKNLARRIMINILILAVITAVGTVCAYTLPEFLAGVLPVSEDLLGLIIGGASVGMMVPGAIAIWRELRVLASLTVRLARLGNSDEPARYTLRTLVQDGLATALLLLAVLALTPLIVRLFALGTLSAPLPIFLLVVSAGLLVLVGFHIHRVLEAAFHDTFGATPASATVSTQPATEQDDLFESVDVETPALRDGRHEPVGRSGAGAKGKGEEVDETEESLWRILEDRVAILRSPGRSGDADRRGSRSESD